MIPLAVTIDLKIASVIPDRGYVSWKNNLFPPDKEIRLILPHFVISIPEVLLEAVTAKVLAQTTFPLEAPKRKPLVLNVYFSNL